VKFERLESLKEKLLVYLTNRYRLDHTLEFPFLVLGEAFGFDKGSKLRGTLYRANAQEGFKIFFLQLSLAEGDFVTFINLRSFAARGNEDHPCLRP
jgi:hypothetical protein